MKNISKRKMESYKRAERVARELRYQMADKRHEDWNRLAEFVIHWMRTTGNIKYERPRELKRHSVL